MNRNLLTGVSVIALAAIALPALAADMPVKAPPVVAATLYNWAGCYIGVHAGYAWGRKRVYEIDGFEIENYRHNVDGGLVGGQVGCAVQRDRFVFGIEGQAAWANVRGFASLDNDDGSRRSGPMTTGFGTRADILGSIAARLGFAFGANGQTMLFGKIGVAFIQEQFTFGSRRSDFQSEKDLHWGPMFGVGIAHALSPNTEVSLEYNANFFGTRSVNFCQVSDPTDCDTLRIKQHVHLVKIGINYRFGSAPLAARY